MHKAINYLVGVLLCLSAIGCGTTINVHREDPARQVQWSDAVATHAMLAFVVSLSGTVTTPAAEALPVTVENLTKDEITLLAICRSKLAREGWKCLKEETYTGQPKTPGEGLYFEVWENTQQKQIVFAFRGTNFSEWADWKNNLRWFRLGRFVHPIEDQYTVVNQEGLARLQRLRKKYGDHTMHYSSTGHSLGGGLAQHLYYAGLPVLDRAIVFDTTPVTGYHDLNKAQQLKFRQEVYRDSFPSYRILRIHEKGEILEYIRNLTQPFYKKDNLIRAVEFRAQRGGNLVDKHSIARLTSKILANGINARADKKERIAEIKSESEIQNKTEAKANAEPEPAIKTETVPSPEVR